MFRAEGFLRGGGLYLRPTLKVSLLLKTASAQVSVEPEYK